LLDGETAYCLQTPTRLIVVDITTNSIVNERQVVKSSKILLEKGMIHCVSSSFIQVISLEDLSLVELRPTQAQHTYLGYGVTIKEESNNT